MSNAPGHPLEVAETLADQLAAVTVAHRDAQEVAGRVASQWKNLIVEMIDGGARIKDVAALAGVSTARIHKIIYNAYANA